MVCFAVWQISLRDGLRQVQNELRDRLTVSLRSVESEIERFRYLSAVVGEDDRVIGILMAASTTSRDKANDYLRTVREMSGADEVYVLDTNGLTLAASNATEPGSFVGNNYAFRPYFSDAMAKDEGRYYAVGVTTGKPGYFLAHRVNQAGRAIGVVVTKVDMSPLAATWNKAGEMTGLADAAGIVFLTGVKTWRYRPLYPLGRTAMASFATERRYAGVDVASNPPITSQPDLQSGDIREADEEKDLVFARAPVEPDGWTLFAAIPVQPVRQQALIITVMAALVSLLLSAVALYLNQRRQLTRIRLDQNTVLEKRVVERTEELAREVDERIKAETELRETHDSLIHAARLAALGRMSAAIVHEVSQPLAALDSRLASASHHARREGMETIERNLVSSRDLVQRMKRTVVHLKTFSSRQMPAKAEAVDLAQVMEAVLDILGARARQAGVVVDSQDFSDMPSVSGNALRLEQVFINLIMNAIDATASAGNNCVSVSSSSDETTARVAIHDTGGGIPNELQGKIMEPFFTTKTTGEGLGLGLSITQAILEELGGTLRFAPNCGGGTRTEVLLPVFATTKQDVRVKF